MVIVFVEPGGQFDPTPMKTQFNRTARICLMCNVLHSANGRLTIDIYCVVSVDTPPPPAVESSDGKEKQEKSTEEAMLPCVRVEFAVKQGARPFGPALPDPSQTHFRLDAKFREFLLSKCTVLEHLVGMDECSRRCNENLILFFPLQW